ncbi:MAG TPA: enoyl-CoA hydratase-related protein, partial [Trebonia sp.]|nr:enoyl-CoA hydratase-related protein [Trebonia sp.]
LVPAVISVPLLRRMSPAAARRYLLTGERFGAREAAGAGLVVSVVPDETVLTELDALGEEFRACEPDALRATRELIRLLPEIDPAEGFSHAARVSAEFFGCEAAREGIAAFRGRRQPRWADPD